MPEVGARKDTPVMSGNGFQRIREKAGTKESRNRLKMAGVFLVMLVFCFASPAENVHPFGISLFLGLTFAGCSIIYTCPMYIISSVIARPSLYTLAEVSAATAALVLTVLYKAWKKKPLPLKAIAVVSVLAQVGYLYICIAAKTNVLAAAASVVLGIVFSYVCFVAGKRVFSDSKIKYTQTELNSGPVLSKLAYWYVSRSKKARIIEDTSIM